MGPTGCPESAVRIYHSLLREISKQIRSWKHSSTATYSHNQLNLVAPLWEPEMSRNPRVLVRYNLRTGYKRYFGSNLVFKLGVGRDSSVSIATRYGLDGPGIESRWGTRFSAIVQTGPGAHPATYTMGTGSFPGVQRPGCGVDHPPHLGPRLKKELRYTSTPTMGLRGLF